MCQTLSFVLYLYSGLVCCMWPSVCAEIESVKLLNGQTYLMPVMAGETARFYLSTADIPVTASHAVFQVHSQWYDVKVSFDDDGGSCNRSALGRYSVGTNIGIVSLSSKRDPFSWCLSAFGLDRVTFKVLVIALVYKPTDPVPGGCNLEFPLENDPNLYMTTSASQTHVKFAYGNVNTYGVGERCGSQRQHYLPVYDVYQKYMYEDQLGEEMFFAAVTQMIAVDNITTSARWIISKSYNDKTLVDFVAYYGQGVVYAVVMRLSNGTHSLPGAAAYVPAVTYSCNFTTDHCPKLGGLTAQITVGVLGCIGLILCFFGHRLFHLELYAFGHLSAQLTVYILTVRLSWWSALVCLCVSLGAGVVGGLLWLLLWRLIGRPQVSMILVGLCLGYIVSCVVFLTTPLTVIDVFLLEYFYQCMFFITVCLVAVVFLAASAHKLSLLSCAVIGSYLFVLTIDWFLIGSGVQQMVLNSIRKSAIPGFAAAYVTVPYQLADISLYTLWGLLSIAGFTFQCYTERNRPQFPVHRRTQRGADELTTRQRQTSPGADEEASERQPLLSGAAAAGHGTVGMQQPSGDTWRSTDVLVSTSALPPPPPYSS